MVNAFSLFLDFKTDWTLKQHRTDYIFCLFYMQFQGLFLGNLASCWHIYISNILLECLSPCKIDFRNVIYTPKQNLYYMLLFRKHPNYVIEILFLLPNYLAVLFSQIVSQFTIETILYIFCMETVEIIFKHLGDRSSL